MSSIDSHALSQKVPVHILLVEDDISVSDLFKSVLESCEKYVVSSTGSVAESITLLRENPDVIIIDLSLPDGCGLSVINFAKSIRLSSRIMVVTSANDESSVLRAIDAGANGYLIKGTHPSDLLNAVHELLDGNSPISAEAAKYVINRTQRINTPSQAQTPILTPREIDVLWGISKGLSYNGIAEYLNISPYTVPGHIKNIYKKLNVHTRGEAVFEAVQLGLISFENNN